MSAGLIVYLTELMEQQTRSAAGGQGEEHYVTPVHPSIHDT